MRWPIPALPLPHNRNQGHNRRRLQNSKLRNHNGRDNQYRRHSRFQQRHLTLPALTVIPGRNR